YPDAGHEAGASHARPGEFLEGTLSEVEIGIAAQVSEARMEVAQAASPAVSQAAGLQDVRTSARSRTTPARCKSHAQHAWPPAPKFLDLVNLRNACIFPP